MKCSPWTEETSSWPSVFAIACARQSKGSREQKLSQEARAGTMKGRHLAYGFLALALIAGLAASQEITGDIGGRGEKSNGALVSGARVAVVNTVAI
ncbi:MAG: hypothetical protein JO159_20445 [Acidobacteria bacterium]|nr:hypothetical protein [Acidobacteriota bacterium]